MLMDQSVAFDSGIVGRAWRSCYALGTGDYQPSEVTASRTFLELAGPCLDRHGVVTSGEVLSLGTITELAGGRSALSACYESALRELLLPYVAPPALLAVSTPASVTPGGLSTAAQGRIAAIASVILAATVVVCVVVGRRVVRPINALADAAVRIGRGDRTTRVHTGDRGQIGALADSFNHMARELDAAEEQRKQMVSDVAHELRTPLGNIRGWLEAAQDGVTALDARLVASLLDESVLLQRIVDDLQDLSLADAGMLTFHPEPLRAEAILRQVADAHRAAAEKAGITLTVTCATPVEFTADEARLRQALGNLVGNAIRYTPAGGRVMLRAERAATRHDAEAVELEVSDTGLGIPPEQLPHVFDRFWRAEHSRSRLSGGSGLGLAIARHLVEAQGGRIGVRSSPGGGTVFTVHMPLGE